MFVKKNEAEQIKILKPRDGQGEMLGLKYIDGAELNNLTNGFYVNSLKVNSEVGYHQHVGNSEIYYVTKGKGIVKDNEKEYEINEGDMLYTKDGEYHSIKNIGDTELEFVAFILSK